MMMRNLTRFLHGLPALALVVLLPSLVFAEAPDRSTSELKKDLRATELEYKNFQGLKSKLESAAKQSSNTARKSAIQKFQDFMGECVVRRESELGDKITLKQHGEMVKSGTTDVAKAGSPVPANKNAKGAGVSNTPTGDRLRQLSNMKSLYVSAKTNSQPAIERQDQAFQRYTETIAKFGRQLELGIDRMKGELDRREAEKQTTQEAAEEQ